MLQATWLHLAPFQKRGNTDMGRIALGIEYDGAAVYGWQRQREVPSVQEHLEKALSTVANEPI